MTINTAGTVVDINGFSPSVGGIVLTNGSLNDSTSSGVMTGTTNIDLRLGGVNAILAGTAGLTKSTTATVSLYGKNTYTGGTLISAGTLWLDTPAKLGSNTTGNDVTVASGTVLQMSASGNIGSNQNLNISTGAVATINSF